MLMQMMSAGAMGGGISSAVARALGRGRRDEADALVLHALGISIALGAVFTLGLLVGGRPLYRALGGSEGSLTAALTYSNIVFAGASLLWVFNTLASAQIQSDGAPGVPLRRKTRVQRASGLRRRQPFNCHNGTISMRASAPRVGAGLSL